MIALRRLPTNRVGSGRGTPWQARGSGPAPRPSGGRQGTTSPQAQPSAQHPPWLRHRWPFARGGGGGGYNILARTTRLAQSLGNVPLIRERSPPYLALSPLLSYSLEPGTTCSEAGRPRSQPCWLPSGLQLIWRCSIVRPARL